MIYHFNFITNFHLLGEGKLTYRENYYEGHFRHDKMLGPGRYVFKNGEEQIGEYVLEQNTQFKSGECVTEWRCRSMQGSSK